MVHEIIKFTAPIIPNILLLLLKFSQKRYSIFLFYELGNKTFCILIHYF